MSFIGKLEIRKQFVILFSALSIIIILSTSYFYIKKYEETSRYLFNKYASNIIDNIAPLALNLILVEDYVKLQDIVNELLKKEDVKRVTVVDVYGKIIMCSDTSRIGTLFNPNEYIGKYISKYEKDLMISSIRYGKIILYLDHIKMVREINTLYWNVIIAIILFSLISIWLSHILSNFFVNPIKRLIDYIEKYKVDRVVERENNIIAPMEILKLYFDFYNFVDILKERETALMLSKKEVENLTNYMQQLIDSIPNSIITVDDSLRVKFVNRRFLDLFELKGVVVGRYLFDLIPDFRVGEIYDLIIKSREESLHMIKLDSFPDRYFDINIFKINSDNTVNICISIEDISEEVKKDSLIYHAQKMDALGVMAGGIAHDINNVLSAMKNSISVMNIIGYPEDIKPIVDNMEKAIYRASNIVKQILSFSRKQEAKREKFDIVDIIQNVVNMLKNIADKSIDIIVDIEEGAYTVIGYSSQMEQAVLNICINGCHAMTIMRNDGIKGGKLTIKVRKFDCKNLDMFEGKRYEKCLQISVSDTGVGISKDNLSKIFDPFFTTKKLGEGTGLGLSIVHRIIKEHDGYITVYSELGLGTTFNIYLPVDDSLITESEPEYLKIEKYNATCMIVDDDELILKSNSKLLESLGMNVISVNKPEDAEGIYRENVGRIDFCIIDVMMPKISGLDLAINLMHINPDIKIIINSGFYDDQSLKAFIKDKHIAFLQKPFSIRELLNAMSQLNIIPS